MSKDLEKIAKKYYRTASNIIHYNEGGRVSLAKVKEKGFFDCFPSEQSEIEGFAKFANWERLKVSEEVISLITEKRQESLDESLEGHIETIKNPIAKAQAMEATKVTFFKFAEDSSKLGAINEATGQLYAKDIVMAIDPQNLLEKLPLKLVKVVAAQAPLARVVYDPKDISRVRDTVEGEFPLLIVNCYKPPPWRIAVPTARDSWEGKLPERFLKFINGLIPDPNEVEIFLDWAAIAVASKQKSMLHLRGARGNGKTVLSYALLAVVGDGFVTQNSISSQSFNGEFLNKRMALIDDNQGFGTAKDHVARRALMNDLATFNIKNVQARGSEQQTASIVVCSNEDQPFYETHDERRVVQLSLAGKGEISKYLDKKYMAFLNALGTKSCTTNSSFTGKEIDHLAQVGHFLLTRYYDNNLEARNGEYYLGGCFWTDVLRSLPDYTRFMVERIISGEKNEYSYIALHEEYKIDASSTGNSQRRTTLFPKLEDMTMYGQPILSEIKKVKNDYRFIPSDYFLKQKGEENDDNIENKRGDINFDI
jgi:hypothetical protein